MYTLKWKAAVDEHLLGGKKIEVILLAAFLTPLLGQEPVTITRFEILRLGKHGRGMKKGNLGVGITL
jgi:hypothetical protein